MIFFTFRGNVVLWNVICKALFVLASDSESRSTQDNRPCTNFIHNKLASLEATLETMTH